MEHWWITLCICAVTLESCNNGLTLFMRWGPNKTKIISELGLHNAGSKPSLVLINSKNIYTWSGTIIIDVTEIDGEQLQYIYQIKAFIAWKYYDIVTRIRTNKTKHIPDNCCDVMAGNDNGLWWAAVSNSEVSGLSWGFNYRFKYELGLRYETVWSSSHNSALAIGYLSQFQSKKNY